MTDLAIKKLCELEFEINTCDLLTSEQWRAIDAAIQALKPIAEGRSVVVDAPRSSAENFQQRGVADDILIEAIKAYEDWYKDDHYDAQAAWDAQMKRVMERCDMYHITKGAMLAAKEKDNG